MHDCRGITRLIYKCNARLEGSGESSMHYFSERTGGYVIPKISIIDLCIHGLDTENRAMTTTALKVNAYNSRVSLPTTSIS